MAFGLILSVDTAPSIEALKRGRDAVVDVVHDAESQFQGAGFAGFLLSCNTVRTTGTAATEEWWVIFSGRLFETRGTTVSMSGDAAAKEFAEVLSEFGTNCLPRIFGEFAVVAIHRPSGALLLARDPLGIEPLYYSLDSGIAFAGDELRSVAAMRGEKIKLSADQASRVLVAHLLADISPALTWIEGVHRVPPGCFVSVKPDKRRTAVTTRYWDPSKIERNHAVDGPEASKELRRLLEAAIARRLEPDVRTGCHLSGGLDSSSIAVLLGFVTRAPGSVQGFSWTPRECLSYGGTELTRIAFLKDKYGISCDHPDGDRYVRATERWSRVSPTFPNVMVGSDWESLTSASSLGIRHMFSGWGGDEFASHSGLIRGVELAARGRLRDAWWWAVRFSSGYGYAAAWAALRRVVGEFLPIVCRSKIWFRPATLSTRRLTRAEHLRDFPGFPAPVSVASLQESLYFRGHLANRIESWASAGSLLGVKYSYPLLDQRLVELCFSLPSGVYCNPGRSRALFRDAVADLWEGFGANNVPKADSAFQRFSSERGGSSFADSGKAALRFVAESEKARQFIDQAKLSRMLSDIDLNNPSVLMVLAQCDDLASKIAALEIGFDYKACIRGLDS